MKTELLAALATLQADLDAASALVAALPNDPAPPPPTPTNLRVVGSYSMNQVLVIQLAWDYILPPMAVVVEIKGAEGNPAGPQEWTDCNYNGSGPDNAGTMLAYTLQNPTDQSVLFRVTARNSDGAVESEQIQVDCNDLYDYEP